MRGYVTRDVLYEEVWSVPLWTLCEKYCLSDNGLRKVCRRLNVPVPPRGYWAKVEAGHKVRKMALPKDAQQTEAQIHAAPKPERTEADDEDDAIRLQGQGVASPIQIRSESLVKRAIGEQASEAAARRCQPRGFVRA